MYVDMMYVAVSCVYLDPGEHVVKATFIAYVLSNARGVAS